jgi:outer membrane protein TolC
VEGSVNLYRGSRDALKDSLQEKETAIRKEETQLVLRSQLSLARELFLRLASIQELKRAWADAVKITQNKKKSSKLKINAGLTTNTDLLEFELYEATLKREKRKLDKEENELSNKLRILLGLSEETEISLDKGFFQPTEPNERNYKLATEAHPAVRKLALQADQAQAISNSGVSRWTPEVDAFASYEEYLIGEKEIPGALPRRDFATGVRVSIPLGDNLTSQNEANARKLEASAYDLQKQQNARQIELVFNARLRDMKVLYELIQDSKNQLEKARKYLKQTSDEYERGIKNGPDVLEASRTLYMTQVESIQLIFEYYLAEVGLHAVAQD